MRKKSIIRMTTFVTGQPKQLVGRIVDAFLSAIRMGLIKEKKVTFRGFGSFRVRTCRARWLRNPQTGEVMVLPSRNVVRFSAGEELRKYIR